YRQINQFAPMGTKARQRACLVFAHEAAITGDISGEDGREPALYPLPAQRCSPRSCAGIVCAAGRHGSTADGGEAVKGVYKCLRLSHRTVRYLHLKSAPGKAAILSRSSRVPFS